MNLLQRTPSLPFQAHHGSSLYQGKPTPFPTSNLPPQTKALGKGITSQPRQKGFVRRVSTLFRTRPAAPRQGSTPSLSPASDQEEQDIDEIRRPSGLGRSVSLRSSELEERDGDYTIQVARRASGGRARTQSSGGRLRKKSSLKRKERAPPLPTQADSPPLPPPPAPVQKPKQPMGPIPVEVISSILSHVPRWVVATLSWQCGHHLLAAARSVLYGDLDLQGVPSVYFPGINNFLVRNPELTHSFQISHSILSFPCLTRMPNLTHLTLPRFDAILEQHSAFGLRSLTFLNETSSEIDGLWTWLDGQINVVELRLPALFSYTPPCPSLKLPPGYDSHTTPPTTPRPSSPPPSPFLSPETFPMPPPLPKFDSPNLIPDLQILHAPHALIPLVARPSVQEVSINVAETLYDGLRPQALWDGLFATCKRIRTLRIFCGTEVDKRTVEKLLRVLCAFEEAQTELQCLEVDVCFPTSDLHRIVASVSRLERIPSVVVTSQYREPPSEPATPKTPHPQHPRALISDVLVTSDPEEQIIEVPARADDIEADPPTPSFISATTSLGVAVGHGSVIGIPFEPQSPESTRSFQSSQSPHHPRTPKSPSPSLQLFTTRQPSLPQAVPPPEREPYEEQRWQVRDPEAWQRQREEQTRFSLEGTSALAMNGHERMELL